MPVSSIRPAGVERSYRAERALNELNGNLVGVFDFDQVTALVCHAARELTGADGASVVLREGNRVRYVAQDAVAPLWKGQTFPIDRCISGWVMLHAQDAAISDIFEDDRVPHAAYRPTFVRSLVMTPVGSGAPVAAIGAYWASKHAASADDVELLHSLARIADVALAGVRAHDEVRLAWAEAEQANRLKDQFLATLSHELRNPLNNIVGFSELLLRTPEANQVPIIRQAASSIHGNARAQARLINDLLDLSRRQTGKFAIERHPVDLVCLVRDALDTVRAQASQKQVHLVVDLASSPLLVNADSVRVQQIVWNLVDNATKFTPVGGQVRVSVAEKGGRAELVVSDTGQGIAPELLPHVFEMFRQGDTGTTRAQAGLGIGLALVRQLCELHDGQVEARSSGLGKGACFIVQLPLHELPPTAGSSVVDRASGELHGARVLVVDDAQDSLEILSLLLASAGADAVTAASGEEALGTAGNGRFDLVVSDLSMPTMDGCELLRRLRVTAGYAHTPAIALTGFGRDEDLERARRAGFTATLTKPLEFASLVALARRALHATR